MPIRDSTEVIQLLNARGAREYAARAGVVLRQMVLMRTLEGRLVWEVYYSGPPPPVNDRLGRVARLRAMLDAASGEILSYQVE